MVGYSLSNLLGCGFSVFGGAIGGFTVLFFSEGQNDPRRGSDTLIGWVIGTLSGLAWGLLDPYGALLRRGPRTMASIRAALNRWIGWWLLGCLKPL